MELPCRGLWQCSPGQQPVAFGHPAQRPCACASSPEVGVPHRGVLFWCQGWQFYKECQGIHQDLEGGKSCEDAGTGEKSSMKLRLITLMSRARAADPESLCRPPSFGFSSVS